MKKAVLLLIECDLATPETISTALKGIKEPSIDAFISIAGVAFEEHASAATKESYKNMFTVKVLAPKL